LGPAAEALLLHTFPGLSRVFGRASRVPGESPTSPEGSPWNPVWVQDGRGPIPQVEAREDPRKRCSEAVTAEFHLHPQFVDDASAAQVDCSSPGSGAVRMQLHPTLDLYTKAQHV